MPDSDAAASLEALSAPWVWDIPEYFNIGVDVCDKWSELTPDKPAIVCLENSLVRTTTFLQLRCLSNRMANLFDVCGYAKGDRVAVFLEQSLEVAISHIAIYKVGGIAVPLFYLFGEEALAYRLKDSGASIVITDSRKAGIVCELRERLPCLKHIVVVDGAVEGCVNWIEEASSLADHFAPVPTRADDPALIIYTSGTTGQPKGALHAHRVLLGHLPGVEISHNGFPHADDFIWTPADWAWIGGLLDVLLPALHHGVPVVAHRFKRFEAEAAFELIARLGIRNMFLPPTAIRALARVADAGKRWILQVRSIASGGEPLGTELQAFCRETFDLDVNEFYGQTECNMTVSSCNALFATRSGYMGKAVPGHQVLIIDNDGQAVAADTVGQIAVRSPDPVMMLEYWQRPEATFAKYQGDCLLTGDLGVMDQDGYIKFIGRDDDIITSSGYRIGPAEIEDCLNAHVAVFRSAVIGKPDKDRTEIVMAFVILNEGYTPSAHMAAQLQEYVRTRLAAHEYPREVAFVSELPMTTTGKIMRKVLRDTAIQTGR
ncbi:MAG: AMP-binding protein [Granulosicoccus sp.]